jgi:hypothetical protein
VTDVRDRSFNHVIETGALLRLTELLRHASVLVVTSSLAVLCVCIRFLGLDGAAAFNILPSIALCLGWKIEQN